MFPTTAFSGWLLAAERAGFFGKFALGAGYNVNDRHSYGALIGVYENGGDDHYQGNLIYRYSRWNIPLTDFNWKPLQFGVFIMRSWDQGSYFLRSPSQYPQENYYQPTLFRFGLELGTTILFDDHNLGLSYRLRVLDNSLVAIYNNTNKDLQYYMSSGLGLQYFF